jgi:hypothetical protein
LQETLTFGLWDVTILTVAEKARAGSALLQPGQRGRTPAAYSAMAMRASKSWPQPRHWKS